MKGIQNIVVSGCMFESSPLGPPSAPGVYLVSAFSPLTKKRLVLYIGSSKNIRDRVMQSNHPYLIYYRRLTKFWVITETYVTMNYKQLEKQTIQQIKPVLNITYNG